MFSERASAKHTCARAKHTSERKYRSPELPPPRQPLPARSNHRQRFHNAKPGTPNRLKTPTWFSQLISSTPPRPLRPRSTSSRPSCPHPAPSSWTSSAPAASPSPPSSRTQTQSSSARAARRSFANQPVARRD